MKNSHFLFLFLAVLLLFVFVIVLTPTPTNWSFSYSRYDKNPHGSFMLYEELDQVFPDAEIKTTDSTLYSVVRDWKEDSTAFILITDSYFQYDNDLNNKIDSFVYAGNQIFISARHLNFNRSDSSDIGYKNIMSEYHSSYTVNDYQQLITPNRDELEDISLLQDTINYQGRREYISNYIDSDSTNHFKLGYIDDTLSNFIRVPHGKGNYYLHSNPGVFTNNAMLHDSLMNYSTAILSHIPEVKHVLWDEHEKPGFFFLKEMGKDRISPIKYLKRNIPIAFWLTILGSLLLIFTKGKRQQQAIPVVAPPNNKSVEFTKTMGRFYHEKGHHMDIAQKRMNYFELDFRRKHKIQNIDEFKGKQDELSNITRIPKETIKVFYQRRELLKKAEAITELQLMQVSKSIENMKPE